MTKPSEENARIASQLRRAAPQIAERSADLALKANGAMERQFGPGARARCREDHLFHITFLAAAIQASRPTLFVHYTRWLRRMLGARGIGAGDVVQSFEHWSERLERC